MILILSTYRNETLLQYSFKNSIIAKKRSFFFILQTTTYNYKNLFQIEELLKDKSAPTNFIGQKSFSSPTGAISLIQIFSSVSPQLFSYQKPIKIKLKMQIKIKYKNIKSRK